MVKRNRTGRLIACPNCGKEKYFRLSQIVRGAKFCNQRCWADFNRGTPEDFWAKVDKRGPEECWLWKAATFKKKGKQMGYGRHAGSGPYTYAHRCAWIFTHGPIPEGMVIMHKCDVVLCCNPAHLRLGTDAENAADAKAKGRNTAKITDAQVAEIRALAPTVSGYPVSLVPASPLGGVGQGYFFLMKIPCPFVPPLPRRFFNACQYRCSRST